MKRNQNYTKMYRNNQNVYSNVKKEEHIIQKLKWYLVRNIKKKKNNVYKVKDPVIDTGLVVDTYNFF